MSLLKSRLAVLVGVVAVMTAGWFGWSSHQRSTRIAGIHNVVLISIDTCRADHLSCYGYKRKTTPHIDAVAREGVLFRQALSPVPITTPAHSSMLTGTYPPTHGVRLNNGEALAGDNVTLAEVLRDAGYQTAAFVGGFPLDAKLGLDQGFDTYDAHFTRKIGGSAVADERTAEEVSGPALLWLEQHAAKPFFLFLHYYDAHSPYDPPPPYALDYADDPYAGEIAYVDSWIGRVVDRLRSLGAYDDTLLVITADHGESLGEHGETAHGFLIYQASQHVPLVIRAPRGRKDRRLDGRVSLVDLMPTVLDLTGLKTPAQVQGVSLRNGLEGSRAPDARRALYCESLHPAQFQCSPLNGIVEGAWKYIRAPRQELYDLTHDPGETRNVFDNEAQVAERLRDRLEELLPEMEAAAPFRARATVDPDTVNRLQSLGYIGGDAPASTAFDPGLPDPKDFLPTFERLEHANSLSRSNREQEAETELLDVVSSRPGLIAPHRMLAELARQARRPADVVEHYAKIVDILTASRNSAKPVLSAGGDLETAHVMLAVALREAGRDGEAIEHYEQALKIKPDDVEALNSLGLTLVHAGRFKDAIDRYEQALKIKPDAVQVHNNLGNVLERTGRHAEAIEQYEHALEIKPDFIDAHFNLGLAFEQAGRLAEAVGQFERALALARSANLTAIVERIEARLAPYRDRAPVPAEAGR